MFAGMILTLSELGLEVVSEDQLQRFAPIFLREMGCTDEHSCITYCGGRYSALNYAIELIIVKNAMPRRHNENTLILWLSGTNPEARRRVLDAIDERERIRVATAVMLDEMRTSGALVH